MPGNPDEGIEPYLGVRPLAEVYQRPNDPPAHVAVAIDAVMRSGSGLDPHNSPDNALLQVRRIAHVRDLNEAQATLTLLLAGRFAAQGRKPATIGTLPCDTPTFGVLTLGVVLLIGALSFLPSLALGPMAEHLQPRTVLFPADTSATIPVIAIPDPETGRAP